MNKLTTVAALVLASTALVACKGGKPETTEAKEAYGLGYMIGKSNHEMAPDLDTKEFIRGFKDGQSGKAGLMTEDEIKETMAALQQKMMKNAQAKMEKESGDRAKANAKLLEENSRKAGVVTTPSGLQYEVISEGKGAKPTAADTVKVHYEGKLTDGTVFDSSIKRGEPVSFPVSGVIPGWTEALQLMPVGAKYRLTIPADLAYGPEGAGPIPPNSVLIFDVELLDIVK